MRRPIIIIVCIFNGMLACGLLWYVLGNPNRNSRPTAVQNQKAKAEPLTDAEMWDRASASDSTREAAYYLSRIQDGNFLLDSCRPYLTELGNSETVAFTEWPFLQAVIQTSGARADSSSGLSTLSGITSHQGLPLTLRDAAFRSLVENTVRFADDIETLNMTYKVIDSAFEEGNSLSETSLQAEHFLSQKGIGEQGRDALFRERLTKVLRDSNQTTSKRIAALNILTSRNELEGAATDELYERSDTRLQTAILKNILLAKVSVQYDWLREVRAMSPEQEQLIQQILQ
ncbi:MAG TPA: hypothetical protein DEA90_12295 [Opitutae bacterium]|nr:hypothetical protein [Puniceicoccaceae bacterium]HBR94932.1 hypothetical protein [Opitutae bacterium]